jgi:hypothetical protein
MITDICFCRLFCFPESLLHFFTHSLDELCFKEKPYLRRYLLSMWTQPHDATLADVRLGESMLRWLYWGFSLFVDSQFGEVFFSVILAGGP